MPGPKLCRLCGRCCISQAAYISPIYSYCIIINQQLRWLNREISILWLRILGVITIGYHILISILIHPLVNLLFMRHLLRHRKRHSHLFIITFFLCFRPAFIFDIKKVFVATKNPFLIIIILKFLILNYCGLLWINLDVRSVYWWHVGIINGFCRHFMMGALVADLLCQAYLLIWFADHLVCWLVVIWSGWWIRRLTLLVNVDVLVQDDTFELRMEYLLAACLVWRSLRSVGGRSIEAACVRIILLGKFLGALLIGQAAFTITRLIDAYVFPITIGIRLRIRVVDFLQWLFLKSALTIEPVIVPAQILDRIILHLNFLARLEVVGASSLSSIPTRVLIVLSEVILIMLRKGGCWVLFIDPFVTLEGLLTIILNKLLTISPISEVGLTKTWLIGCDVAEDILTEHVSIPALENGRLILISMEQGADTLVVNRAVIYCRFAAGELVVVNLCVDGFHLGHFAVVTRLVERKGCCCAW